MHSLLRCGIGYGHDSKDDNHFICNVLLYKVYVAYKMVSTGTYLSTYINTVKEGGLSLPSSCEEGATAPPPPPHSYALVQLP